MKKSIMLLLAGLLVTWATVASAGNQKGFSFSPTLGGITFDGTQHLDTSPLFGGRLGYNFTKALGVEALFNYAKTQSTRSDNEMDMYHFGGELLYHFMPDNKFVPYIAAGYSGVTFKAAGPQFDDDLKGAPIYGLGAKYFVTDDVAWRVDVRHLLYKYDQYYNNILYTVGLYFPFGGGEPAVEKLPEPPPPPAPAARPAAPLPPPAPLVNLTADPASVIKGQTSTLTWSSQNATECDMQPGIGAVAPKGSMTVTPDDTTSYAVTCKGEGGTARSAAIVSVSVPPPPPVSAAAERAAERFCNKPALLMINFDTDKWNIKPRYHNELKTVGDFLKLFPKAKGTIDGHTDSTHTNAHNQKLSERRANSVKEYIIRNFGIAPDRIGSIGYGEDRPIATNKTKVGRAKNRRIEANFVCE